MKPRTYLYGTIGMVGAAAGAMAAYIVARPKLRRDLQEATSGGEAMASFRKHLKRDSTQFMHDARDFARHSPIMEKMRTMGRVAQERAAMAAKTARHEAIELKKQAEKKIQ